MHISEVLIEGDATGTVFIQFTVFIIIHAFLQQQVLTALTLSGVGLDQHAGIIRV